MKINPINQTNYMTKGVSFKHTVVPYPEYENAYHNQERTSSVTRFVDRLSSLFTPEVSHKSKIIKDNINRLYESETQVPDFIDKEPKKHLLSVFA